MDISIWWLVIVALLGVFVGMVVMALLTVAKREDEAQVRALR